MLGKVRKQTDSKTGRYIAKTGQRSTGRSTGKSDGRPVGRSSQKQKVRKFWYYSRSTVNQK